LETFREQLTDDERLYAVPGAALDPDPAKRHGKRKYAGMPAAAIAGLKRYRAGLKSKSHSSPKRYDRPKTKVKYRTKVKYKTRKVYEPAVHHKKKGGHRRRYDIGISNPFWSSILQPFVTSVGGIAHNWAVRNHPQVAGGIPVGSGGAVGYLGLAGGIAGALAEIYAKGRAKAWGGIANAFGSGMMTEAVNLPQVEGIATIPTQKARSSGYTGMAPQASPGGMSPYVVMPHQSSIGQGTF